MRRTAGVLVAIAVLAVGCGDADSASTTASVTFPHSFADLELVAPVETVADALIDDLGADTAVAAVLVAFERGYSFDQTFAAASEQRLGVDGEIAGIDAGTETPAGEPLGLIQIARSPGAAEQTLTLLWAEAQSSSTPHHIFTPAQEFDARRLMEAFANEFDEEGIDKARRAKLRLLVILGLAATGYSTEQIAEFLVQEVAGDDSVGTGLLGGCMILGDVERNRAGERYIIAPEGGAGLVECDFERRYAQDGEETIPPDEPDPRDGAFIFGGTGLLVTTDRGEAMTCRGQATEVEATIFPDQRFEIIYTRRVTSAIPPGVEIPDGDPDSVVDCVDTLKRTMHRGVFDPASGTIELESNGDQPTLNDLTVVVADSGEAKITGTITATDFLNDWRIELDLTE